MSRSDRLFDIIQILRRASRPLTAEMLAATLEVTPRTIYRDIAALQATRVPIEGAAGVGYVMRPGFDLPPVMFTPDEVQAILVGLALLRRTGDRGLVAAAGRVSMKLADILPEEGRRLMDDAALHVSRHGIAASEGVDPGLLRAAIHRAERLTIGYRDGDGHETARTVLPLALLYYVEVAVLVAWCDLRADFRHFRIDRITRAAETGPAAPREAAALRARYRAGFELP